MCDDRKLYQVYNADRTWSEETNDHGHDGIKRNGLFYFDDPSHVSGLIIFLRKRKHPYGVGPSRLSEDHIKYGVFNYFRSTDTITKDGHLNYKEKGLATFQSLIEFQYPPSLPSSRAAARAAQTVRGDSTIH